MKKLVGGCLFLGGLMLLAHTAYRRFLENDFRIEWYWWAGGAGALLIGIMFLAQRD